MSNYKLGNFICKLREELGMDQKTLAALLGVSSSAISQCENGGGLRIEKLYQIAELFGVTLDELLSGNRAEQPIKDRLDDLYYINEDNFQLAINRRDYKVIIESLQRIKRVRERFNELIYKRIFAKTTKDENTEIEYIMRYYTLRVSTSPYFDSCIIFLNDSQRCADIKQALLNAIGSKDKIALNWELNNFFSFNVDYHLKEILGILESDSTRETEQSNVVYFRAVFETLPQLTKDLIFSFYFYEHGSFNAKLQYIESMVKCNARLFYLPTVKNMFSMKEDVIMALEGEVNCDVKLTQANEIYREKFINGFEYNDYISLSYFEYLRCINEDGMKEVKELVRLWQENKSEYWNKYKHFKYCNRNSKEVRI